MKTSWFVGAAFAALLATPAMAADMPVKAPIGAPPIVSVYNWNGFYIGGHGGWGFVHTDATSDKLDPNSFGTHFRQSNERSMDGFIGGGQIGFNWMALPNVVLGIEADLSGSILKDSYLGISSDGISYHTDKADRFGTVRGRIGYAFDNWLIYGTGGFAWAHAYLTSTQGPCGPNGSNPTCLGSPVPLGIVNSNSLNETGWTVGGGVEYGIARNWTAKLEYLYMDFGSVTFTNPSFNRTGIAQSTMNVVRLGLNYKFSGF